jgi:VanZ family protein
MGEPQKTPFLMGKFLKHGLPALLWAILIFVLSSVPRLPHPIVEFEFSDKIYHVVEFFILGYLLARAGVNLSTPDKEGRAIYVAVLLGIIWGGIDEIHQAFVAGRDSSFLDGMADAIGVVIAGILFWWKVRRKRRPECLAEEPQGRSL